MSHNKQNSPEIPEISPEKQSRSILVLGGHNIFCCLNYMVSIEVLPHEKVKTLLLTQCKYTFLTCFNNIKGLTLSVLHLPYLPSSLIVTFPMMPLTSGNLPFVMSQRTVKDLHALSKQVAGTMISVDFYFLNIYLFTRKNLLKQKTEATYVWRRP